MDERERVDFAGARDRAGAALGRGAYVEDDGAGGELRDGERRRCDLRIGRERMPRRVVNGLLLVVRHERLLIGDDARRRRRRGARAERARVRSAVINAVSLEATPVRNGRADCAASTFLDEAVRNGRADCTASTFLDEAVRNGRADCTASTFLDEARAPIRTRRGRRCGDLRSCRHRSGRPCSHPSRRSRRCSGARSGATPFRSTAPPRRPDR